MSQGIRVSRWPPSTYRISFLLELFSLGSSHTESFRGTKAFRDDGRLSVPKSRKNEVPRGTDELP